MSQHKATISWQRTGEDFLKGKFSREHKWIFDGGMTVIASASPVVVPAPWSNPVGVDPEEAFVASLASCHMLTFLWLASRQGFKVESYRDEASGEMMQKDQTTRWVGVVTLRPQITYGGAKLPAPADEERLHHLAHEQCYIANSVKTQIKIEPVAH